MIKTYTILSCLSNKSSYDQIMRKNANNFWHFYDFTIKRYISFYLLQNQKKKTLSSENLSSFFSCITVIIQPYRVYAVKRAKVRYFSIEKWRIIIAGAFQESTDQLSEYTIITIFVHHGFTVLSRKR